jgi:phosphoglycerate dehydrogenase-like enzyme
MAEAEGWITAFPAAALAQAKAVQAAAAGVDQVKAPAAAAKGSN